MLQLPANPAPKTGRSRFSKALPAVPGLDTSIALPPPPKYLPSLPSHAKDSSSPYSNAPLPYIPVSIATAPIPRPPTAMSIPRKPIGKPPTSAVPEVPEAQSRPESTDSILSLLSAYSRSSGESLVRTSDGAASMRESDATMSPTNQATVTSPSTIRETGLPSGPRLLRKPVGGGGPPPSPPTKDSHFQSLASPPPAPAKDAQIASPSSPRPQIWRRRSRSGSRDIPDLKLNFSHGSTAETLSASRSAQEQPSTETLKSLPRPPQTGAKGLPGRNIRPAAVAQAERITLQDAQQPSASADKALPSLNGSGASNGPKQETTTRPTANRPPTPEYQKEDVRSPIVNTYATPVSPASSPEPAQNPTVPPKSASRAERKPLGQFSGPAVSSPRRLATPLAPPAPIQDLHAVKSAPDLRSKTPSPSGDAILRSPASGEAPMGQGQFMNEMRSNHFRNSGDSVESRARSSSARPGQRRPMEQSKPIPPEMDPRLVWSETQGWLYKGRDGTLYPEMKDTRDPESEALNFPAQPETLPSPGTIYKAPALKESHQNCFQKHRHMNRRSNRNYPLSCQACERADVEDRWTCTFCCLRVCEPCLRILNENQRDLHRLTEALRHDTNIALHSNQRPDSALGLVVS